MIRNIFDQNDEPGNRLTQKISLNGRRVVVPPGQGAAVRVTLSEAAFPAFTVTVRVTLA